MRLIVCCNSLLTSLPLSLISKLPRVQNCSLSSLCIPECTYHTNARSAPLAPILYKIVCLIFAPIVFFIKHWRLFKNLHFRSDYCYYYPTCKLSFKWEGEVVKNKKNILDKRRQIMDTRKTVTYWHFNKCVFVRYVETPCVLVAVVVKSSRVWVPSGAVGEFSSLESISVLISMVVSVPACVTTVVNPSHSAKSAGGRLHLNTHAS